MAKPDETCSEGLRDLRQAAAFLTLSPRTTIALAHSGALPYVRVSARRIAFRTQDLQAYVRARTVSAKPAPVASARRR